MLDIVLQTWAITVAATLAASLAAFFRARHVEDDPVSDSRVTVSEGSGA